jgi:hypothetical protein
VVTLTGTEHVASTAPGRTMENTFRSAVHELRRQRLMRAYERRGQQACSESHSEPDASQTNFTSISASVGNSTADAAAHCPTLQQPSHPTDFMSAVRELRRRRLERKLAAPQASFKSAYVAAHSSRLNKAAKAKETGDKTAPHAKTSSSPRGMVIGRKMHPLDAVVS